MALETLFFVSCMGILMMALVWLIITGYQRQRNWVVLKETYDKHKRASEKLKFTCVGTVVDAVKVKIPYDKVVEIPAYVDSRNSILDQEFEMEYASGRNYSHIFEYYQLIQFDPEEFLEAFQVCVNTDMDKIKEARIHWEIMYIELCRIAQSIIDGKHDLILAFYKPITEDTYNNFVSIEREKEDALTSIFSFQLFSEDEQSTDEMVLITEVTKDSEYSSAMEIEKHEEK